ncbi:MAG: hypothetical protein HYV97_20115 [Bdellovibrio sp.]|nr:hypothetical protein [Bdellovibrio sp.]
MKEISVLIALLFFCSCTTYNIGKFDAIKPKNSTLPSKAESLTKLESTTKKTVAKDCTWQVWPFVLPPETHNIEKVSSELCNGKTVKDVEIHEEIWFSFFVNRYCTVATGHCLTKD